MLERVVRLRPPDDVTRMASPARTTRWHRRLSLRSTPYAFLAVPLALLIVFTYIPVVNMVLYSFTDWDGLDKDRNYVGLENYTEIFTRPELFSVFRVSLYYLGGAAVQIAVALYFATVLSFKVRFRNVFKGVLFFPYLINGVAIGFIFLYFFRPDGVLDATLALGRMEGLQQRWLGDRSVVNFSLVGVSVWRYMGLNFVLFLGAIQSIQAEIFDAASIDGASRWRQFRHIIAPSIKPVLALSIILAVSGALSVFEIPYVMLGGANGSKTFVIQTVEMAFEFRKVGLASAMAVVLLVFILVVYAIQRMVIRERAVDLVT